MVAIQLEELLDRNQRQDFARFVDFEEHFAELSSQKLSLVKCLDLHLGIDSSTGKITDPQPQPLMVEILDEVIPVDVIRSQYQKGRKEPHQYFASRCETLDVAAGILLQAYSGSGSFNDFSWLVHNHPHPYVQGLQESIDVQSTIDCLREHRNNPLLQQARRNKSVFGQAVSNRRKDELMQPLIQLIEPDADIKRARDDANRYGDRQYTLPTDITYVGVAGAGTVASAVIGVPALFISGVIMTAYLGVRVGKTLQRRPGYKQFLHLVGQADRLNDIVYNHEHRFKLSEA